MPALSIYHSLDPTGHTIDQIVQGLLRDTLPRPDYYVNQGFHRYLVPRSYSQIGVLRLDPLFNYLLYVFYRVQV